MAVDGGPGSGPRPGGGSAHAASPKENKPLSERGKVESAVTNAVKNIISNADSYEDAGYKAPKITQRSDGSLHIDRNDPRIRKAIEGAGFHVKQGLGCLIVPGIYG